MATIRIRAKRPDIEKTRQGFQVRRPTDWTDVSVFSVDDDTGAETLLHDVTSVSFKAECGKVVSATVIFENVSLDVALDSCDLVPPAAPECVSKGVSAETTRCAVKPSCTLREGHEGTCIAESMLDPPVEQSRGGLRGPKGLD
jgi:hypothetical protein